MGHRRRFVLDAGALIAMERGKERASRFVRLAQVGAARLLVPYPVVAEWWRGRTDPREEILAATEIVASVHVAKAAGVALAKTRKIDAGLTVDAIVIATAAMLDGVVLTSNPKDFERLGVHFPGVTVLPV